jgi:hypothetical protein
VTYFPPCASCSPEGRSAVQLSTLSASDRGDDDSVCKLGLSLALRLSSEGVLLHVPDTRSYAHIPSASSAQVCSYQFHE